jgi:hypothetical protein
VVGTGVAVALPRGDGAFVVGVDPDADTTDDGDMLDAVALEVVTLETADGDVSDPLDTAAPAGDDDAHAGSAIARTAAPAAVNTRLRRTAATLRREPGNAREGPP